MGFFFRKKEFDFKNYDLGEVIDLKQRGKIVPSIFWAIPVGKWSDDNLNSLWEEFTEKDKNSLCKDVYKVSTLISRK